MSTDRAINAHTVGGRYAETADLDIADVAKLIRRDIATARKTGAVPSDVKTSVRISRYSMGQSITVTATLPDRPARVPAADPRSVIYDRRDEYPGAYTYTREAADVLDLLGGIVAAYNWDNSDIQTDYFSSRFHGHVVVAGTGR